MSIAAYGLFASGNEAHLREFPSGTSLIAYGLQGGEVDVFSAADPNSRALKRSTGTWPLSQALRPPMITPPSTSEGK
jgi:hypothetical protein